MADNLKKAIGKLAIIILVLSFTSNTVSAAGYKQSQLEASRLFGYYNESVHKTYVDPNNKLYAMGWNEKNNYIIRWNGKKRMETKLKMPASLSEATFPIYDNNFIASDGSNWLSYSVCAAEGSVIDNYYFTRISSSGRLLTKININEMFNLTDDVSYVTYKIYEYKKNKAVILMHILYSDIRRDSKNIASVIDFKENKLLWKRIVSDNEGFFSHSFGAGIAVIAENKYIIGLNEDSQSLIISDIKSGEIFKEIKSVSDEDKIYAFEYRNKAIYIVKKGGVYKQELDKDKMKKLVNIPSSHWLLKGNHYVYDISVVNDNEIYLLGANPSAEGSTRLYKFKK